MYCFYCLSQGYSTSFSKGPDPAHEKSLGPGKLRKSGKGPEYMKNKFWLKTELQKKVFTTFEDQSAIEDQKKVFATIWGIAHSTSQEFLAQRSAKVR